MNDATTYINGLTYDPATVLVDNSAVPNYERQSGAFEPDGTFLVFNRKQCTVESSSSDLTFIDALASRVFPGTMVLCNSKLIENQPATVNVKTKPTRLTIDLPGVGGAFEVPQLTKSHVTVAVDAKIKEWKTANPQGTVAAKIKSSLFEVKSQHKLEADLGFKLSSARQNLNVDFNAVQSGASREWVLKFEQVYFNVSLDTFNTPGDIIADDVTTSALKAAGIDNKNPLGIVHNVSYGRIVYVRFKTTNTSLDLAAKINLVTTGATQTDTKARTELKQLKEQFSTDVFVYGGGTAAFSKVPNVTMDTIHEFIAEGYNLDAGQVAAPIGYGVVFMRNGGQDLATVKSTSTYVETTTQRHDAATLQINQNGWFVNKFYITWNEISFDTAGNPVVTPRSWDRNGKDSLVGHRHTLFFKGNVRNLHVTSKGKTGIVWDPWRTNLNVDVPLRPNMAVTVSGTTLNQSAKVS